MSEREKLIKTMEYQADRMIANNLSRVSKKYIKKVILARSLKIDPFFWNNGVLSWSLHDSSVATPNNHKLLKKRFELKLVDNSLFYYANYDKIDATSMNNIVSEIMTLKRNNQGSILYRATDTNVFIDALGMAPQLLVRYGVEHGVSSTVNRGVEQFDIFINNAMDNSIGLPYHAYNSIDNKKMGIVGWGRSLGWILVGLSESLFWLDRNSSEFKRLEEYFVNLTNSAMKYQFNNGALGWQLQAVDGPEDTSTTSMIGFAIMRYNERTGRIFYQDECTKMAEFIESNIQKNGTVIGSSAECKGLSIHPQVYGSNSWGQGFSILFLKTLERGMNNVKSH